MHPYLNRETRSPRQRRFRTRGHRRGLAPAGRGRSRGDEPQQTPRHSGPKLCRHKRLHQNRQTNPVIHRNRQQNGLAKILTSHIYSYHRGSEIDIALIFKLLYIFDFI